MHYDDYDGPQLSSPPNHTRFYYLDCPCGVTVAAGVLHPAKPQPDIFKGDNLSTAASEKVSEVTFFGHRCH